MHISDGILSPPVLITGFVTAGLLAAATTRKLDMEEIPKVAVMTSVFFVASLIHVPIGPSSVHLLLIGLAGIILGKRAFPAVMVGIFLQAILFGHGGITVLGVNWTMMGGGALVAHLIWQQRWRCNSHKTQLLLAGFASGIAIVFSGMVMALAMISTGTAFLTSAKLVLLAHIPIVVIEGLLAAACVHFLSKTRPDILGEHIIRPNAA